MWARKIAVVKGEDPTGVANNADTNSILAKTLRK